MAEPSTADAAMTEPGAEHSADADLPKSVVQRLVRAKAIQMIEAATKPGAPATAEKRPLNVQISKDALLAFSEAGKVFINYLASTANDIAKENKRITMSANDVLKALEDLEFSEFVQPLQQYLEAHKATLKERPTKKKEGGSTSKKRKAEIHAVAEETAAATEKAAPQPSPVPLAPLQQEAAGQPETAA